MFVLLLSAALTAVGQNARRGGARAARASKASKAKVEVKAATEASAIYEDMLSSTAKLLIIDSIVTDKDGFLSKIPLNKESGAVYQYDGFWKTSGQPNSFVYVNEFGNKMYFSKTDNDGKSKLYTSDRLEGKWMNTALVRDFDDEFSDINCPFLMSDGVTLYFSAKRKDGVGGYDLYVTMYDADSAKFYKPENLGLPYNSEANDYYCMIDEFDSLGWLVTDRRQPAGKVCIYTFVPSASRDVYDVESIPEEKLRSLGGINRIRDTWADEKKVASAKARLASLLQREKKGEGESFSFAVNDDLVYEKPGDFKSAKDKEKFGALVKMKASLDESEQTLDKYRMQYAAGNASAKRQISGEIMKLERQVEQQKAYIRKLEKEIRNAENIIVNKQ